MSENHTYLYIDSDKPLADLRFLKVLGLVDEVRESEGRTGLTIELCDVADWHDAEHELSRLIESYYGDLDHVIDHTNPPIAVFYVGPANELVTFEPRFLALCASLSIEIRVHYRDPPDPTVPTKSS